MLQILADSLMVATRLEPWDGRRQVAPAAAPARRSWLGWTRALFRH